MILARLRRSCINILQGANLSKGIKANGNTIKTTLNAVNTRFKAGSFRSRQASLFEFFYRGDGEGFAVYGEFDFVAREGKAVGALGVINVGGARVLGKDLAKDFSLIFGQWGKVLVACLNA